jgi:hypothetical protein
MTEGDKVVHEDDPENVGTIVGIMFERIFVKWDNNYGKTTIEPAGKLRVVNNELVVA